MSKFLDLSGFGISGKGAFIDLFREFDGYDVPRADFEFSLLRVKDGILDLKKALVDNWSPVRSDVAIKRFKKLILDLGLSPSKFNIIKSLSISGARYNDIFNGKFTQITNKYIDSLVDDTYYGLVVYPMQDDGIFVRIFKKIVNKLGFVSIMYSTNYISSGKDFENKTKEYFLELFNCRNMNQNVTFVIYNAFEPFNPQEAIRLFDSAKAIVIDRDPRDIYLAALKHPLPNDVPKNLDIFISRFKIFRHKINIDKDNKLVLYLNFEDLVLNYEETLNKLFIFLGEDKSIHKYPKKYFDPEVSKKGVGMWKNVDGQLKKDIDKIYSELKDYCLDI